MKIAAYRESLMSALAQAIKVLTPNKSVPILAYVRVDVEGASVTFTATDLITSLTVSVSDCKATEAGSFLVPAVAFQTALRASTAEKVVFGPLDDDMVGLWAGSTNWKWKVLSVDQFPKIATWDESVVHTLDRKVFLASLSCVRSAASEGSFNTNLEQIGVNAGNFRAADGVRFYECSVPQAQAIDTAIPLPFAKDLISVIGKSTSENFQLGIPEDGKALIVRCDNMVLMSRVRAEKFPNLNDAFTIPEMTNAQILKVDREKLCGALKRVQILADENTRAVGLEILDFATMRVFTRQRTGSTSSENVSIEWNNDSRQFWFNLDYLLGALSIFDDEEVSLKFGKDQKQKPSSAFIRSETKRVVLHQLRIE